MLLLYNNRSKMHLLNQSRKFVSALNDACQGLKWFKVVGANLSNDEKIYDQ
jgi:hypothetical protein